MRPSRLTVLGFLAGLVLGMGDYFLLRAVDVTMLVDGRDVTLFVVFLFALNFGALGAFIARLWEGRAELQSMQAELVEAQTLAAVGRMAAGVAHEVRNPLSTIKSSAQLLGEGLSDDDAQAARFICDEVDRLDGFVGRVLNFSRPLSANREVVDFAELRRRLTPMVGDDVSWVEGIQTYSLDPDLTVQLLANLVENARKSDATEVRIEPGDGSIVVIDNGAGIDPSVRDSLFEPFVTTRAQGTGLGLAMARKLARVQGWELELADSASTGATFRFRQGDSA